MSYFIEKREGKTKTSYRVQIIIKQAGRIIHRESKAFSAFRDANAWGAQRDKLLKKGLDDAEVWAELTNRSPSVTVGELIQRYQLEYSGAYGRTVGRDLDLLSRSPIAEIRADRLKSGDIVAHVRRRLAGYRKPDGGAVLGVSPATAANDLTRLRTVLDAAWASWDIPVPRDELEKARIECRKRRMVAKSAQRERTATPEELDRLTAHFEQAVRGEIPMAELIRFAVASCRRLEEITQLRWADNDPDKLTGVVPRLKDPSGSRVNVPFRYTREAWDIAQRQPEVSDRIFPYNPKSIGTAFTRACRVLGIEDLRFHDLRHTAVTNLFRQGYQIHEVTAFSLHRSWATLKRYYNESVDQVPLR